MIVMQNTPRIVGSKPIVHKFRTILNDTNSSFTGRQIPSFQKTITISNLSFSYDSAHQVLNNISCVLEKNKKYAIVGASGSGNSTFVNLLTGLSSHYTGEIFFDEKELKTLDFNQVLSLFSVIQQNVFLFDESIRDNIVLHTIPDSQELSAVCQSSGVNLFIHQLKHGIDTVIEENGGNISGGQQQRIAIAHSILRKKPIMIRDEGTSAINQQTTMDIENSLLNMADLTLLTITHNLGPSLLGKYDCILFIKDGELSGMGSYEKLSEENTTFMDFCSFHTPPS